MLKIYEEPCQRIWAGYKTFVSTSFVMRSGVQMTGMTEIFERGLSPAVVFKRRGESNAEHSAKMAFLCSVFASNFPGFFGTIGKTAATMPNAWGLLAMALIHDVGELKIGDIPDNGTPEHEKKDVVELEVFKSAIEVYGAPDQEVLLSMFRQFQKRDTFEGKALYALDKAEAILTLLFLEQFELYGEIGAKAEPTDSDRHFMRATGTPCATDCWCAHSKTQIMGFPEEITEPVFALIETAVKDVRGEMFDWWNESIEPWR